MPNKTAVDGTLTQLDAIEDVNFQPKENYRNLSVVLSKLSVDYNNILEKGGVFNIPVFEKCFNNITREKKESSGEHYNNKHRRSSS